MSNYLERVAEMVAQRVDRSDMPDGPVDSLMMSYAVLALAKGTKVTSTDVHNAWVAWTQIDPSHEALVPFDDLPSDAKSQDTPFVEAIRQVAANLPR